jgi:hypothetical protein
MADQINSLEELKDAVTDDIGGVAAAAELDAPREPTPVGRGWRLSWRSPSNPVVRSSRFLSAPHEDTGWDRSRKFAPPMN